jgi:hypothetical protein
VIVALVGMMVARERRIQGALKERRDLSSSLARYAQEDGGRGVREEEQPACDDRCDKARTEPAGEREHVKQIHHSRVGLISAYQGLCPDYT